MPTTGPFHSLTQSDKNRLTQLITTGSSVRAAAHRIGCNYTHALNFAHHHKLITPTQPPVLPTGAACALITAIKNGASIHAASIMVGIPSSAGYRIASRAGLHTRLTRRQQHIRATARRIGFLYLRLTGIPRAQVCTTLSIGPRQGRDFEKGLVKTRGQRRRFIPTGPDAATYNRLMDALIETCDVIEEGRRAVPALPDGVNPYKPVSSRYLSVSQRAVIADMYREGATKAAIARAVGVHPSTIGRELSRNRTPQGPYRAESAQLKAAARRLRPKTSKILANRRLYDYVVEGLRRQWSPQQISGRIRLDFPDAEEMRISHETIYDAFYLDAKGRLKDLGLALPTGRKKRRPRGRPRGAGGIRRFVDEMVLIDDRPDEVAERVMPGHWEGDLILGKNNASAVITLVERVSRFVVLGHLPARHDSVEVARVLKELVGGIDELIFSSITWDQGSEMAGHKAFSMATDVPVYFCHPGSPWERGTNEDTNGRLRRNLPKSSDLSVYSSMDLEMIANIHNNTPRKALGWRTPAEVMAQALADVGSITD
ncbi:IS30 family transposase [Corynebacterium frankenforstense]